MGKVEDKKDEHCFYTNILIHYILILIYFYIILEDEEKDTKIKNKNYTILHI